MKRKKKIEHLHASFGLQKEEYFHFELINMYFAKQNHNDCLQKVSDKTCNDLDFEELFIYLDRTNSKVGQQYLYHTMRTIPKENPKLDLKEEIIERILTDKDFRVQVQLQLDKLNHNKAYYLPSLFQDSYIKPPKWYSFVPALAIGSFLSMILMPFIPKLFILFLSIIIINVVIHFYNKSNLYTYLDSIPQLLTMSKVATNLYGEDSLKQLDPHLSNALRSVKKIRNRMSFFQLETRMQGEFQALFWALMELVKIAFLIEPLFLFGILKDLDKKRKEIESIYTFIGETDLCCAIASIRFGTKNYCIPKVEKHVISANNMVHPLIADCVPNSIVVSDKSILLTGSNMSGKTSFIRAIGVNMITGLTLNTCFAEAMTLPRIKIYSAIRISDDLLNDKSYYFEEVLTIKEMINNSLQSEPGLFLLDEIFKGTNTIERISAGKAVLDELSKNGNYVFVSTHDIELTDLLKDAYSLYHFSEVVENGNVGFDYLLKEGKLTKRNAIRILEINDYPTTVIEEAIRLSKVLDEKQ